MPVEHSPLALKIALRLAEEFPCAARSPAAVRLHLLLQLQELIACGRSLTLSQEAGIGSNRSLHHQLMYLPAAFRIDR